MRRRRDLSIRGASTRSQQEEPLERSAHHTEKVGASFKTYWSGTPGDVQYLLDNEKLARVKVERKNVQLEEHVERLREDKARLTEQLLLRKQQQQRHVHAHGDDYGSDCIGHEKEPS
ncbi:hypothetical protein FOZ60_001593 [Perkinsus olseni]|uniref:Uncharacterized protein n=1 Tax=Perkinsus olseni TaxID=32597 RepID=A0A7J6MPH9_PEROL|nr:hypothetical protein FOZ60_001593 [Perkinsus olseni]KAF4673504.1 hypothetical protein FOZ60_001593 [Perkinsus olseni]